METREKQAYLIEAHKCDEMLLTLLRMLDVPWNDIFIHMDSKNDRLPAGNGGVPHENMRKCFTQNGTVLCGAVSVR